MRIAAPQPRATPAAGAAGAAAGRVYDAFVRRRAFALASLLLLSAAAGAAAAEREVSWLREHAIALRPPARGGDDFADLEPLKAVLAGRRVVLLGEATHGDGAVFAAKARFIVSSERRTPSRCPGSLSRRSNRSSPPPQTTSIWYVPSDLYNVSRADSK